jgi:glucose-6-phosphate 1-dehydrogenase
MDSSELTSPGEVDVFDGLTLGFHEPPLRMFPTHRSHTPNGRRDEMVIDFADPDSITLGFAAKEPGAQVKLGTAEMTFRHADSFSAAETLKGYERLLLDAMFG